MPYYEQEKLFVRNAPSRFDSWFWSPGGLGASRAPSAPGSPPKSRGGWGHSPTPSRILKTNRDKTPRTKRPLFVVGHEAKRSARLSVHPKRTGTCMPYYERKAPVRSRARSEAKCPLQAFTKRGRALTCPTTNGKSPLCVVGHEAKRSARLSVHKKRTGTDVPYYEREKPFVRSRARSEAKCPL